MLTCTRLRDQPRLAHALREQALCENLVGLVSAAVKKVLTLQVEISGQVSAAGQGRRAARIVCKHPAELGLKGGIILRLEKSRLELLQRWHQDLGNVSAPEPAEPSVQAHLRSCSRQDGRSVSNSARIFTGDFIPGMTSSADPTSIA